MAISRYMTDINDALFGYPTPVLTSSYTEKMRLKCKELFHGSYTSPHDAQMNAALIAKGH